MASFPAEVMDRVVLEMRCRWGERAKARAALDVIADYLRSEEARERMVAASKKLWLSPRRPPTDAEVVDAVIAALLGVETT